MSVFIKGIEMPECCDVCIFSDWSNLYQTACCKLREYDPCFEDFSKEYKIKRSEICPLISLPEKHGRLFDTDEVIKCLEELEPDCKEKAWAIGLVEWAIAKRWCIEAEGEG